MGSNTSNFSLYKPDAGEDDWTSEVNNNFDTIDTELRDERIEDLVNSLLSGGNAVVLTYDDANDTLTVAVASDSIQTDELDLSITPVWTGKHQFDSGIDVRGDIEDDTTVIWDSAGGHIQQTALENDSVTITAGDGLKNGGSVALGSSVTVDIEPADFAGTLLSDDGSDNLRVDEGNISHDGIDQTTVDSDDHHSRYTDEEAQDAIDALLGAGNAISLSYDDANNTLTVGVVDSGIDHDSLNQYVANEHIDHSGVDITAGKGLTGGGDITASRTIDAQDVTTQTSNYTASENDIVLADASGGGFTVTLPSASESVHVNVKKTDSSSNTVTVATPNTETIDGNSNLTISSQYVSRTIISDGSDYFII